LLANTIPYAKQLPIRILDVGAGYGALTQFLLSDFPNATAVCQDGSEQMAKLGQERMKHLKGRVAYALCDFSKAGWSRSLTGTFESGGIIHRNSQCKQPEYCSRHLRRNISTGKRRRLFSKF
jgi:16S rRNA C1402 N4-methylase RsmH